VWTTVHALPVFREGDSVASSSLSYDEIKKFFTQKYTTTTTTTGNTLANDGSGTGNIVTFPTYPSGGTGIFPPNITKKPITGIDWGFPYDDSKRVTQLETELKELHTHLESGMLPILDNGKVLGHILFTEFDPNRPIVRLKCDDESHRVEISRSGTIKSLDHPCLEADLSLLVMSKEVRHGCTKAYEDWLNHRGVLHKVWRIFFGQEK
jgi:hypothetical protein